MVPKKEETTLPRKSRSASLDCNAELGSIITGKRNKMPFA